MMCNVQTDQSVLPDPFCIGGDDESHATVGTPCSGEGRYR